MPLYEVAILEVPTEKEMEDGAEETLIMEPKSIVARDPQMAGILASAEAVTKAKNAQRLKVIVRPF